MTDPTTDRGFEDLLRAIDILSGTLQPDSSPAIHEMAAGECVSDGESPTNSGDGNKSADNAANNVENVAAVEGGRKSVTKDEEFATVSQDAGDESKRSSGVTQEDGVSSTVSSGVCQVAGDSGDCNKVSLAENTEISSRESSSMEGQDPVECNRVTADVGSQDIEGRDTPVVESVFGDKDSKSLIVEDPLGHRQSPIVDSESKDRESPTVENEPRDRDSPAIDSESRDRESPTLDSESRDKELPTVGNDRETLIIESESSDRESPNVDSKSTDRELPTVGNEPRDGESPTVSSASRDSETPTVESESRDRESLTVGSAPGDMESLTVGSTSRDIETPAVGGEPKDRESPSADSGSRDSEFRGRESPSVESESRKSDSPTVESQSTGVDSPTLESESHSEDKKLLGVDSQFRESKSLTVENLSRDREPPMAASQSEYRQSPTAESQSRDWESPTGGSQSGDRESPALESQTVDRDGSIEGKATLHSLKKASMTEHNVQDEDSPVHLDSATTLGESAKANSGEQSSNAAESVGPAGQDAAAESSMSPANMDQQSEVLLVEESNSPPTETDQDSSPGLTFVGLGADNNDSKSPDHPVRVDDAAEGSRQEQLDKVEGESRPTQASPIKDSTTNEAEQLESGVEDGVVVLVEENPPVESDVLPPEVLGGRKQPAFNEESSCQSGSEIIVTYNTDDDGPGAIVETLRVDLDEDDNLITSNQNSTADEDCFQVQPEIERPPGSAQSDVMKDSTQGSKKYSGPSPPKTSGKQLPGQGTEVRGPDKNVGQGDDAGKTSNKSDIALPHVRQSEKPSSSENLPLDLEDMEDTFPHEQNMISSAALQGSPTDQDKDMEVSVIKLAKPIKQEKIDTTYDQHSLPNPDVNHQPPRSSAAQPVLKLVNPYRTLQPRHSTIPRVQVVSMGPVTKTTTAPQVGSSPSLQNMLNMNNQLRLTSARPQQAVRPKAPVYRVVLQGNSNPGFGHVNASIAAARPQVQSSVQSSSKLGRPPGSVYYPKLPVSGSGNIQRPQQPAGSQSTSMVNGLAVRFVTSSLTTPSTSVTTRTVSSKTSSQVQVSSKTSLPKSTELTQILPHMNKNGRIPSSILLNNSNIKYVPGPPPPGMDISDLVYYPCSQCDDIFLIETSLRNHMIRRSMLITYKCDSCAGKISLVFFNRCTLLEHLKKHHGNLPARRLLTVQRLANIVIQALPEKYVPDACDFKFMLPVQDFLSLIAKNKKPPNRGTSMGPGVSVLNNVQAGAGVGAKQASTAAGPGKSSELAAILSKSPKTIRVMSAQRDKALTTSTATAMIPTTVVSVAVEGKGQGSGVVHMTGHDQHMVSQRKIQNLKDSKSEDKAGLVNCPECNKSFLNSDAYRRHFSSAGKPMSHMCLQCNMCLPGECALSAHRRIHVQSTKPQVCPDCGQIIRGNRSVFIRHLEKTCFHFCRTLVRKCPACPLVHWDEAHLRKHFLDVHSETYYKCRHCPMAFKSKENYTLHNNETHGEEEVDFQKSKSIYKCPLCDTVFHQSDHLLLHLKVHIALFIKDARFGYKCPKCLGLHTGLPQLLYHLRIHNISCLKNLCDICGVSTADNQLQKHMDTAHKGMSYYEPAMGTLQDLQGPKNVIPIAVEKAEKSKVEEHSVLTQEKLRDIEENKNKEEKKKLKPRKGYEYAVPADEPKTTVEDMFKNIAAEAKKKRNSKEHEPEKTRKKNKFLCDLCGFEFNTFVLYQDHMLKHKLNMKNKKRPLEGPIILTVKKSKLKVDELEIGKKGAWSRLSTHPVKRQVEVEEQPPFPCSECSERFFERDQLQDHLEEEHCIQRSYICHICGNTYNSEAALAKHRDGQHEGRKDQRTFTYTCLLCEQKGITKTYKLHREYLVKHIASVHRIPRSSADVEKHIRTSVTGGDPTKVDDKSDAKYSKSAEEEDGDVPMKKLKLMGDDVFTCSKCCFDTDSRLEFLDHIKGHRTESESHQCRECGMCFMSQPSLKKHLFILHKVRDFHHYFKESGQDLEAEVEETDPINAAFARKKRPPPSSPSGGDGSDVDITSPSSDNNVLECTVCYREFDNNVALRNHMRSHGMAFIRSKRMTPIESS